MNRDNTFEEGIPIWEFHRLEREKSIKHMAYRDPALAAYYQEQARQGAAPTLDDDRATLADVIGLAHQGAKSEAIKKLSMYMKKFVGDDFVC